MARALRQVRPVVARGTGSRSAQEQEPGPARLQPLAGWFHCPGDMRRRTRALSDLRP
jgi:hypothetical protein